MDDRQLKALIKKTAAKAERAKPKQRKSYDPTLDATRTPTEPAAPEGTEPDALGDADEIFKEMKRRSF